MSRDPSGDHDDGSPGGSEHDEAPASGGRLGHTPPGAVTLALVVGLIGGWLVRRVAASLGATAPLVSWSQALVLFLGAAILAVTAWHTGRALDGRQPRPEPHRLVNRLVLARACALAGALVAGGYLGFGLMFLTGLDATSPRERVLRSAVAVVAGAALSVGGLLLERACKVPGLDDEDDADPTAG